MKNLIRSFLKNPVLANMLMLIILVGGTFGAMSMSRELFPKFSLDAVSVSVSYPGADPEETEEAICLKLEEAIDGIEGVKEISTTAAEGSGSAIITLEDGADLPSIMDEIKTEVDGISTFPDDCETPIVKEVKYRGDVLSIMVWGKLPERQLKEISRKLKDELLQIKGISQASVSGIRDYEISVEISEEMLRKYDLTIRQISEAIRKHGYNFPAGSIRTPVEEYRIRALGRKYHGKEYSRIPIITRPDGTVITLAKIAKIKDTFDDDSRMFSFFNGMPAASINVFKTDREDAIQISDTLKEFIARKRKELPPSVNLTVFRDRANMIRGRLNMLLSNGRIGLILVFLSLWLFLDIRLSFWVTMGIPISIAGAMIIMALSGCSINMLSLFGMIMVLGLIVDDAIVVGESIYSHRSRGSTQLNSAVDGTSEVALPVIAAVATTVVAFMPLFAISGVMGKFIRQIPIPVVAALSVSLIEGLFILPVHLRHLPRSVSETKTAKYNYMGKLREKVATGLEHFISNIYGPFIDWILHWRYAAICVAIAVLMIIIGLMNAGIVKFTFMEKSDSDFLKIMVEMTPGTPLEDTKKVTQKILSGWKKVEKEFTSLIPKGERLALGVYTLIGSTVSYQRSAKPSELEVNVELLPSEVRNIFSQRLLTAWKNAVGDIPGAIKTNFKSFRGGPGGLPIEVNIKGDDYNTILQAADALIDKIRVYKGVYDEQVDYSAGKREFIVKMKPEAYHHALTLDDIASHVKGGFYGDEALSVQRGRDDVKVKVRFPEESGRNSIEYFKKLRIETPRGYRIPLTSVAEIKLQQGQSSINRVDRNRVVKVEADVDESITGVNAKEIMKDIKAKIIPEIEQRYNVICDAEGQDKENQDALKGLYIGFPMAMLGIYFIIASMFRSYIQPMIIMTTIPFGLIGGVVGHILFGRMISLLSMFGMVALAGIVVNDAIVLIEGVNARLENGVPLFEAIREGGKRRFRAILLTTITTFSGLMPLILEKSFQAQFLIPMALSIAFGVLFATILTLVLLPCQLAVLSDVRRVLHFAWYHEWKSREELEPRVKALTAFDEEDE
ncbi:MAG: efflux RND transporter permease subunit [Lentisphaerae bacterium]|nr:efflux RND transporter permease subunit [Lentisphaerota bacterium]MCP4101940.1 efflux RND transporter permease subunit [Lentisphaerota bacterium]